MQPKAVREYVGVRGCASRPTTIRTTLAPTQGTDVQAFELRQFAICNLSGLSAPGCMNQMQRYRTFTMVAKSPSLGVLEKFQIGSSVE